MSSSKQDSHPASEKDIQQDSPDGEDKPPAKRKVTNQSQQRVKDSRKKLEEAVSTANAVLGAVHNDITLWKSPMMTKLRDFTAHAQSHSDKYPSEFSSNVAGLTSADSTSSLQSSTISLSKDVVSAIYQRRALPIHDKSPIVQVVVKSEKKRRYKKRY
jgi:hypothetical protein